MCGEQDVLERRVFLLSARRTGISAGEWRLFICCSERGNRVMLVNWTAGVENPLTKGNTHS